MATKLYTLDEMKDRHIGLVGTKERDEYERKLKEDVEAYHLGEAIRKARLQQNLSQQQLGDRIGVKRAQISKIETGGNITLRTYSRVFKALGIATASIDMGGSIGKVALW